MKFRNDINGLRAYAVLAVVIFHFFPDFLTGGFAGVDVFFVISGFLMTAIITNGIQQQRFSLVDFYLARANRIIPPLAVLCIFLLVFGYYFLPTYDFRIVGRDIFGAISFTSNVIFSLKQDYFEGDTNFLLHTWSLSAEWQFYIFYPIIILCVAKLFGVNKVRFFILGFFTISFFTSVVFSSQYPSESYYLLPTRAWEMAAGGLVFYFPLILSRANAKVVEVSGITLILASYVIVNESVMWPGYMALLPVLGTCMVISSTSSSFFTTNKVAQYIGQWSYSIYLWHWPLAVACSYYYISPEFKFVGIFLSILLGFISYQFIEKLDFKSVKRSKLILAQCAVVCVVSCLGVATYASNGFAFKESLNANSLIYGGLDDNYTQDEGIHFLNTKSEYDYVLIGDSKAGHLIRGILNSDDKVKLSWYSDCLSLPEAFTYSHSYGAEWTEKCKNNYKQAIESSKDILISQRWVRQNSRNPLFCSTESCSLSGNYNNDISQQLSKFASLIGERHLFILGELARPATGEVEKCARTNMLLATSVECAERTQSVAVAKDINYILKSAADKYANVTYIDPNRELCNEDTCIYAIEGKSIYQPDLGHLTGFGSELIWSLISKEIERTREQKFHAQVTSLKK